MVIERITYGWSICALDGQGFLFRKQYIGYSRIEALTAFKHAYKAHIEACKKRRLS